VRLRFAISHGKLVGQLLAIIELWWVADSRIFAIGELYSAILIAIKLPVVTGRNWPFAASQYQN
jgi:hypothetical protein